MNNGVEVSPVLVEYSVHIPFAGGQGVAVYDFSCFYVYQYYLVRFYVEIVYAAGGDCHKSAFPVADAQVSAGAFGKTVFNSFFAVCYQFFSFFL